MKRKPIDGLREWQSDPTVTGVNRLPQRATFYPHESQDEAKRNSFLSGGRTMSLNGAWQFLLCDDIAAKPQHFYEIAAETDGWSEIAVPEQQCRPLPQNGDGRRKLSARPADPHV